MHTTHTSKSHSQVGSHISQEQQNKATQLEIDNLKKELRHPQRKRAPSSSDISSTSEEDASYRQRSRTPPIESFSYDEEHHHKRRYKSPPRKGLGNDAVSKELNRISKSPLTRKIEGGKTSPVIPSAHIHHLQWLDEPCRTCEPIQSEDGCPF